MKNIIYKVKCPNRRLPLLSLITLILLSICGLSASGDNIISSGTTLKVSSGTTLVSTGVLRLKSGGTLNNLGTVILKASFYNENSGTTDFGTGTFVLNGTMLQTLNGTNTFGYLTMDNAFGAQLDGSTTVNYGLTFTQGIIILGPNDLLLGSSAIISGTPSALSMAVATGTGVFRKSFTGPGSFTFPVGDNTGVPEYSPVMLTFSTGSFGNGNFAGVRLVNSAYPTSTGSYLNRYWTLFQNGIANFTSNAVFQYVLADVVGTESDIYCTRVDPLPVVYYNVANTALHQLTADGLTSFGTYTGQLNLNIGIDPGLQQIYRYRVYPNPSTGMFFLERPYYDQRNKVTLIIFNLQGQLVFRQDLEPADKEFSVQLPAGVYVLKIQSPEKTQQELITIR